jgi:putative PEP-CTERM system TPR-repeat lipoprotein
VYCALLALTLPALAGCGDRKSAADYVKAAEAHLAAGDVRAAAVDLKNALQKEPKNATARVMLGQTYVTFSDASAAEVELQHARDDGAPPSAYDKPLAQAELMLRKPKDVLPLTQPIEGATPQLAASLLSLRAQAYYMLGQNDDAEQAFAEGLKVDPQSIDVLTGMGRAALVRKDVAEAKTRLAVAQQAAPKDPQVLELAGDVAFVGGDFAGSEQAYKDLHDAQPWNLVARLGMSRAQISESKLKDAIGNLDALLKSAPKDARANYLRALAAYLDKDMPTVQTYTERALSASPKYAAALLLSGASNYALKQYEQANNALGQYVELVPDNLQARKLLASTQLQLNRPGDAVNTLKPAMANAGNDADLLAMIGTASARSGDTTVANEYLGKAVAERPDNAALRTELGLTEIRLGDTATGVEELEKAAQQNPKDVRPELALFLTYMRDKQFDKALEISERLQKSAPDNSTGWNFASVADIAKGDKEAARAALLKAIEIRPGDLNANRNLAKLAYSEGKIDDARKYYNDALKANPTSIDTALDLAALELKAGKGEQAEAVLVQASKDNPDNPAPLIIRARIRMQNGQVQDALNLVEPALAKDPRNPALLEVAGLGELALGKADSAVGTLKTLVDVLPKFPAGHLYLAQAYAGAGRNNDALSEANEALHLDPTGQGPRLAVARSLLVTGKLDEANKAIADLKKDYPQNVTVADLEGAAALAQNRPKDAIPAYQRAILGQDNSANEQMLAKAEAATGDLNAGANTLNQWLDKHPEDLSGRLTLGDIYLRANKIAEAKDQYAAVVAKAPDNVLALNNLAWTLSQLGKPNEALAHARHAVSLAPDAPQVLDTLGVILLQNGIAADAVDNLKKARQRDSNNPAIQFHLAQALAGAGKKDDALDMLHGLLAGNDNFSDRPAAEKLLHDLAGG